MKLNTNQLVRANTQGRQTKYAFRRSLLSCLGHRSLNAGAWPTLSDVIWFCAFARCRESVVGLDLDC